MAILGSNVYSTIIGGSQNHISNRYRASAEDFNYYKEVILNRRYRSLVNFKVTADIGRDLVQTGAASIPIGMIFTGEQLSQLLYEDVKFLPSNAYYEQEILVITEDNSTALALFIHPLSPDPSSFILLERPVTEEMCGEDKTALIQLCFQMVLHASPEEAAQYITNPLLVKNTRTFDILKFILKGNEPVPYLKESYAPHNKEA